jgi:5'-deoxynucleotidase
MNTVKSNFLGWVFRMKFIKRWGLMFCFIPENIAEHSHEVSIVAHLLAIIKNKKFGGNVNAEKVATTGLYHDISEVISTDLPNPVKYWNEDIAREFKKIEHMAEVSIHESVQDDEIKNELNEYIISKNVDEEVKAIVKSADIICAFIKARDEFKYKRNHEFKDAYKNTRRLMDERISQYPEVKWFIEIYVQDMAVSIDELMRKNMK